VPFFGVGEDLHGGEVAMTPGRRRGLHKLQAMLTEGFGVGRAAAWSAAISAVILGCGISLFFYLAPPTTITVTSGPTGSAFGKTAGRYAKILERSGVTLRIVPSEGSVDNLKRLAASSSRVDVGFVQAGVTHDVRTDHLVSLGSIGNQPLFVFYRGEADLELLSQLAGKRIAVGEVGSGTHTLSLELLAANGIRPGGPTKLLEPQSEQAAADLKKGELDAVFLMGDSVSTALIRELLHTPGIRLFDFTQADGYVRRIPYLNKITLPRGTIDFGTDTPADDVYLLGPTIELIARESLHPALSDLLIEAAQELHSGAGLFRRKGEFPTPTEQGIRISSEATRFYKSGKSFLYRSMPFRVASLVNRIVVVLVPMIVLLLPALRVIPGLFRWRFRARIFKWYRALLMIEHYLRTEVTPEERRSLLEKLDRIEEAVNRMNVPASYADQFYGLRGHITFVRARLQVVSQGR
jgi:TRAP-type uncharacterized transport system substrate-binding protein